MRGRDPMDALRHEVRAAAHREITTATRRRRPWMPAVTGMVVLAASGGVATAIGFLSVGREKPGNAESAQRYGPKSGTGMIAVTAEDPERTLPWGVLVYQGPDGQACALAGQVRGQELGVEEGGAFRPFGDRSGATCGRPGGARKFFYNVQAFGDRSIVFGRAATGVTRISATFRRGQSRTATVGAGGAFLFVFDGALSVSDLQLRAAD